MKCAICGIEIDSIEEGWVKMENLSSRKSIEERLFIKRRTGKRTW